MAAIAIEISKLTLEKARAMALPHRGQTALHEATGISKPTLRVLLAAGKAIPATIKKLEKGLGIQTADSDD